MGNYNIGRRLLNGLKLLHRNHDDRPRVNPLHIIINWLNETVDLGRFAEVTTDLLFVAKLPEA